MVDAPHRLWLRCKQEAEEAHSTRGSPALAACLIARRPVVAAMKVDLSQASEFRGATLRFATS